jgi:hypothetical protein
VKATGPGQVWSWDITDLYSPWVGKSFKAYSVLDIYSRHMVAWRVEEREGDHLAVETFEAAIAEHGAPLTVHADSGPAMRSNLLATPSPATASNSPTIGPTSRMTTPSQNPGSDHEIQARLPPRVQRSPDRQSLPGRLRALVQHPTQTLRHCPFLTLRSSRRLLERGLENTRPCTTTTRTPDASGAGSLHPHQPAMPLSTSRQQKQPNS